MSNWREWGIALAALAIAGAALQPLVPKTGTGKLFRLILSSCFLCVLLWPLHNLNGLDLPKFDTADPQLAAQVLQERLRDQVETQINAVLTDSANQALNGYRLQVKKAEAAVDIDEDNCISIKQVRIYLDARNFESSSTVLLVLRQQFGTEVVIIKDE